MKKTICIILACFLLVMTPIKGYASSAPLVFGLGEEVILPFLLSLLGVQAVNQIDSYEDLVSYNNEVYGSLMESLSGLVGFEAVQAWILRAVQGTIETDSVIWQKLRELALANYVVNSTSGITVDTTFQGSTFDFQYFEDLEIVRNETSGGNTYTTEYFCNVAVNVIPTSYANRILYCSTDNIGGYMRGTTNGNETYKYNISCDNAYTYDGKTIYYSVLDLRGSFPVSAPKYTIQTSEYGKAAWLMLYGGFVAPSENIAEYSGAFDLALSAQQKEDIIDGTSVIQLYNPADEQNGLHFVPDPEEPDDIKIPFAVTADWWNYLKQFGNDAKEQVVQAYNALNGLSGNSIGSISDAYDRLGIASVLSSAQSATEGIASLTDSNVYPNSFTVADTINNSIPSSLTPQTPDDGIDNESEQGLYKLPDLRDYFPFCIPFDLIDLLSCFVAEPETPSFVIALSTGEETVSGNMDLHIWDNIAGVIRTFELIGFTVGLILITRNIIRG